MYDYRKMTPEQRREAVEYRRLRLRPWHSPPHWEFVGLLQYMISGSCYQHESIIGVTPQRMSAFENTLLEACGQFATRIYAWCVLPNHYHLLLQTAQGASCRIGKSSWPYFISVEWRGRSPRTPGLAQLCRPRHQVTRPFLG
jgi:hypothetical protein